MYRHGVSVSSVTPDKQFITRKNKNYKTSDTSIAVKESIQEPYNPSTRADEDGIPDVEKFNQIKHLHQLKIRKTKLMILMRRLMVPKILQVKLVVLQVTWAKNMKMKRMKNSVKRLLR